MNAAGVTEVIYEGINVGDKDFSALIAKMKEAGVSIIYWGGLHTEAGLIIRQMADQGLKATLISGDGIVSNELASIAGDAVDGTLNTFGPDPTQQPYATRTSSKNSRPPASIRKPTRSIPTLPFRSSPTPPRLLVRLDP